ncbi:unnamed protein product [Rotaria sp. Silwood2]|nr:unnamed protein product [Rotaria sp. Silwood2]
MSNEVILCIWDQLSSVDVIYSFSNLNTRMNSLLLEFHGLYKQLDLRYCSLSACRFLCRQVSTMFEWRLGLTVLKLGSPVRCSQMDLFVDEVAKSVIANHFERHEKSSDNISKDIFRILMAYKHIQPIFPQLVSLHIFLTTSVNKDTINTLLLAIAGGSAMRTFALNSCANQTHHSRAFFNWLFRCSINLVQYKLQSSEAEDGFEIMYEHTIVNNYVPHYSLVYLKINILNLNTLYVLLHYLPELEHLDGNISGIIGQINAIDQNLITKFNYPKKLRVFILRNFKIVGPNCSYLEQLVDKFNNTLEEFSLFLIHYCSGELDICFDGHRLAALCSRLSHLRSLHFAIQLRFIEPPSRQILYDFIEAFRTPFWLDGPLGRIRITNGRENEYLHAFLQRLDRLHIECSSILNKHLNEEVMIPLLSFVINKRHFPRLECLRFIQCKHILSAWCNIDKWIDFIFTHINENQLKYLRFSFIEKEQAVTDMQTGDETITMTDPPCIVDIHRLVSENRISFWIERKYK